MKAFLFTVLAGALAGLAGLLLSYVTEYRLLTWIVTGMLLAMVIKVSDIGRRKGMIWAALGGAIIVIGYFIGQIILFPMVAWLIFGAVFVALNAPKRVLPKIIGALVGFFAGILGIGILPLITMVFMPLLGFSSSFAYDIEELGFIMIGIIISMTAFLLRKWK